MHAPLNIIHFTYLPILRVSSASGGSRNFEGEGAESVASQEFVCKQGRQVHIIGCIREIGACGKIAKANEGGVPTAPPPLNPPLSSAIKLFTCLILTDIELLITNY